VNVDGVFLGCRAGIAAMRRSGRGSIINISSIAALVASPYATAYGASKATVRHLTKTIAQHCAKEGLQIRCNSVHPGMVRTSLWDGQARKTAKERGLTFNAYLARAAKLVPLGDLTRPEDVAATVAFLASDDARHITGAEIPVDGGLTTCDSYHFTQGSQSIPQTKLVEPAGP